MARNAIQEARRVKDGEAAEALLRQAKDACNVIVGAGDNLSAVLAKWQAGVASGAYDAADVTKLQALVPVLTPVYTAAKAAVPAITAALE